MTRNVAFGRDKGEQKSGEVPEEGTPGAGPSGTMGDPAWEAARALRQQYEEAHEAPGLEPEAATPGEPLLLMSDQPGSLPEGADPPGITPLVPGAGLLAESQNPLLVRQAQLREVCHSPISDYVG